MFCFLFLFLRKKNPNFKFTKDHFLDGDDKLNQMTNSTPDLPRQNNRNRKTKPHTSLSRAIPRAFRPSSYGRQVLQRVRRCGELPGVGPLPSYGELPPAHYR